MIPHPLKKERRPKIDRCDLVHIETHVGVSLSEARRESRITYSFVCVCKSIDNSVETNDEGEESIHHLESLYSTRVKRCNFRFYSYV